MEQKKLKVAVVGVGGISEVHINGYKACPDVELYAFCDINAQRLKDKGEKYNVTRLYTDVNELLEKEELDFIMTALPTFLHEKISTLQFPSECKEQFINALYLLVTSEKHRYINSSELIFWGYGENELFPSYVSYIVSLAFDGKIKYTNKSQYVVSNQSYACVEPFAQTDVANTVVRGIDDDLRGVFYDTYS